MAAYLQPFSRETKFLGNARFFQNIFCKVFFSDFYVGRTIKSKAEGICLKCCLERLNRERKKTQTLNNCKDWGEKKGLGVTDGRRRGTPAKLFAISHQGPQGLRD